jgi:hypothetical protein
MSKELELLQKILEEQKRLRNDIAKWRQQVFKYEKEKEVWVTAHGVKMLTGWENQMLRNIRQQGLVRIKYETNGGLRYLLSSVEELKEKLKK